MGCSYMHPHATQELGPPTRSWAGSLSQTGGQRRSAKTKWTVLSNWVRLMYCDEVAKLSGEPASLLW